MPFTQPVVTSYCQSHPSRWRQGRRTGFPCRIRGGL